MSLKQKKFKPRIKLNHNIYLDATKFVLLGSFTLIERICSKMWTKPLQKNAKSSASLKINVLLFSLQTFVETVFSISLGMYKKDI